MNLKGKNVSQIRAKTFCLLPIGYLLGGHVMRLFHGHDEVVAIPGSDQSEEQQRCEKNSQQTNKQITHRSIGGGPTLAIQHTGSVLTQDLPLVPLLCLSSLKCL